MTGIILLTSIGKGLSNGVALPSCFSTAQGFSGAPVSDGLTGRQACQAYKIQWQRCRSKRYEETSAIFAEAGKALEGTK
jgi:hypothetical protein